ncbi:hypothetical protein ES703_114156 [subsurface metagenome]
MDYRTTSDNSSAHNLDGKEILWIYNHRLGKECVRLHPYSHWFHVKLGLDVTSNAASPEDKAGNGHRDDG